jgi:hypothetical protein
MTFSVQEDASALTWLEWQKQAPYDTLQREARDFPIFLQTRKAHVTRVPLAAWLARRRNSRAAH